MKCEGRFMIGSNQAGKGSGVSRHWSGLSLKKIRTGLQKLFGTFKSGQIKCSICKHIAYQYSIDYLTGKERIICSSCKVSNNTRRR